MIEQFLSENSRCALVLRPRRAMTKNQFFGVFAVIALCTWAVALLSYLIGNVFAPVFALLDCVIVAAALHCAGFGRKVIVLKRLNSMQNIAPCCSRVGKN